MIKEKKKKSVLKEGKRQKADKEQKIHCLARKTKITDSNISLDRL